MRQPKKDDNDLTALREKLDAGAVERRSAVEKLKLLAQEAAGGRTTPSTDRLAKRGNLEDSGEDTRVNGALRPDDLTPTEKFQRRTLRARERRSEQLQKLKRTTLTIVEKLTPTGLDIEMDKVEPAS